MVVATVIVATRDIKKSRKNFDGIENIELEALEPTNSTSIEALAEDF